MIFEVLLLDVKFRPVPLTKHGIYDLQPSLTSAHREMSFGILPVLREPSCVLPVNNADNTPMFDQNIAHIKISVSEHDFMIMSVS
jgi:hypothetical protein